MFRSLLWHNGGETARGVTEDSITIVYWRWQENDFILNYITGPIAGDDTNADAEASLRGSFNTMKLIMKPTVEKSILYFMKDLGT